MFAYAGCDNYALIEGFRGKAQISLTFIRINKRGIKIIKAPVLLLGKKNQKLFKRIEYLVAR